MMSIQTILSLVAAVTIGGIAGGAAVYQATAHVQVTCPATVTHSGSIPPGFFASPALPTTGGKQY